MYYIHIVCKVCKVQFPTQQMRMSGACPGATASTIPNCPGIDLGSVQIGSAGSLSSCVATIGTICNLRFISSPQISVKDTFLDKGFFPNSIFHVIFILQVEIKYLVHLEKARGATEADEPI